jgi:hypothetical protein
MADRGPFWVASSHARLVDVHFCLVRTDLRVVRLPSRICRLSVAVMDAVLAFIPDRPGRLHHTTVISREFDEAGVKRDRRWLEELREREHVRNRPTRLPRPVRLRRIAHGDEQSRHLIFPEIELPRHADRIKPDHRRSAETHRLRYAIQAATKVRPRLDCLLPRSNSLCPP